MIVGALRIELVVEDARTLKDKRRVIRSVKDVLRNDFGVSIAEVGHPDEPRFCTLGVAMVSNETADVHRVFDRLVDKLRAKRGVSLIDYDRTMH